MNTGLVNSIASIITRKIIFRHNPDEEETAREIIAATGPDRGMTAYERKIVEQALNLFEEKYMPKGTDDKFHVEHSLENVRRKLLE